MRIKLIVSGGELNYDLLRELQLGYSDVNFEISKVDLSLALKVRNQEIKNFKESELEEILKNEAKTREFLSDNGLILPDEELKGFLKLGCREKFFRMMKRFDVDIKTSQPSPGNFYVELENSKQYKLVVVSTISGEVSGTYNSALLAFNELDDDTKEGIALIDSKMVSVGVGYAAVRYVQDFLKSGTKPKIRDYSDEVFMRAVLFDISHFVKGGRGKFLEGTGKILGICPYLTLKEGRIQIIGKSGSVFPDAKKLQLVKTLGECVGEEKMLNKMEDEAIKKLKDFGGNTYTNLLCGDKIYKDKFWGLKNKFGEFFNPDFILGSHLGPDFLGIMMCNFKD